MGINTLKESNDDRIELEGDMDMMELLNDIPELDVKTGLTYCMDEEFYKEVLEEYVGADKLEELNNYYNAKDWENYRIKVHALKSTSMTIGAVTLSEGAKALEAASKELDEAYITAHHDEVMKQYEELLGKLRKAIGE